MICSFEDYTTDQNFSDVIFTMKSNPVDAVVDIPSVEEKPGAEESKKEVRLLKGIYAFEDLWPSQGDYDMNDVMVKLDYEKPSATRAFMKSHTFSKPSTTSPDSKTDWLSRSGETPHRPSWSSRYSAPLPKRIPHRSTRFIRRSATAM